MLRSGKSRGVIQLDPRSAPRWAGGMPGWIQNSRRTWMGVACAGGLAVGIGGATFWYQHSLWTQGVQDLAVVAERIRQAYGPGGYAPLQDGNNPDVTSVFLSTLPTSYGHKSWPFGGFARISSGNGGKEFFIVADNISVPLCTRLLREGIAPPRTYHVRVNGSIKSLPMGADAAQAACDLGAPVGLSISWQLK